MYGSSWALLNRVQSRNCLVRGQNFGLENIASYNDFQKKAQDAKFGLLRYLIEAKDSGLNVLGYGAAAKGSTLLNYAGIKSDLLSSVAV